MASYSCCISYSNVGSDHLPTKPLVPASYLRYLQVGEVALVGFFAIHTIRMTEYSLSISYSEQTAKSIRSLIRIAGTIIVIAVVISYLSQNPVIAASISIISGLVIGFAASNLIGMLLQGYIWQ